METSQTTKTTSRSIKFLSIIFIVVVVPLIIVIAIETFLRISGYGVSTRLYIDAPIAGYRVPNNDYHRLFHPITTPREVDSAAELRPHLLSDQKNDNELRIAVIGGSTADGWPYYSNQAFHAITARVLEHRFPDTRVTVLNLAKSAMSSYYVREVSRQIRDLEPDVIILYTGHNEYYGTISAGTGGNHSSKLLYMQLKRLRIGQWLFNLTSRVNIPDQTIAPRNLMESRLAAGNFPQDEKFDRIVARNYLRNLETVRRRAATINVPLVILEPISNLVDMPPFAGESAIRAWQSTEHDIDILRTAKDKDIIPFRARSLLVEDLKNWSRQNPDSVHYVELEQPLLTANGPAGLGDAIFIDHLHFNMHGQAMVGSRVAQELLTIPELTRFFRNDTGEWPDFETAMESIHYTPEMELRTLRHIAGLLQNEPFSAMDPEYSAVALHTGLANNWYSQNSPRVYREVMQNPSSQTLPLLGDFLIEQGDPRRYHALLRAMVYVNPGNYNTNLNLARFYASVGESTQLVNYYFQRAFQLSDQSDKIIPEWNKYRESVQLQ